MSIESILIALIVVGLVIMAAGLIVQARAKAKRASKPTPGDRRTPRRDNPK